MTRQTSLMVFPRGPHSFLVIDPEIGEYAVIPPEREAWERRYSEVDPDGQLHKMPPTLEQAYPPDVARVILQVAGAPVDRPVDLADCQAFLRYFTDLLAELAALDRTIRADAYPTPKADRIVPPSIADIQRRCLAMAAAAKVAG